ncbi:MAG: ABC transporter permease [Corynebacterium sp.]|nr:ABC transporter permease [Corynebacterium sp.]
MSVFESLSLAISNLRTNKMRSALTLLGVIIGIASVIMILTIGSGLRTSTLATFSSTGGVDMTVQAQPIPSEEEIQRAGGEEYYYYSERLDDPTYEITAEDLETIQNRLGSRISGISLGENNSYSGEILLGNKSFAGSAQFVNTFFFTQRKIEIAAGRALTDDDINNNRPVGVLSDQLAAQLFGGNVQSAIGKEITFESEDGISDFTIIGVQKKPETNFLIGNLPSQSVIYVPYTLESRVSDSTGSWQTVTIRAAEGEDSGQFKAELDNYFTEKLDGNTEYRVQVRDSSKDIEQVNQVLGGISAAIAGIGGISLLVGGLGVMNIMLITVTERTREIGIRKALGAKRKDIRRQFVIEAMVVCIIGGIFGIVFGSALGMLITNLMFKLWMIPPINGIIGSLFFCLAIGLFFGWYPANRAGKLDPIEALRYE